MTILAIVLTATLLAFAALAFVGLVLLLKAILWLVILPFRLLWWLIALPFLILKALLVGVSAAFVVGLLTVAGVVALAVLAIGIALPLLPFALIAFGIWWIVSRGLGSPASGGGQPAGRVLKG